MYAQIIFGTRFRQPLILPAWENQLYAYITGIVQKKGPKLMAINGMPDHLHIFISYKPADRLSDLVMEIKKSSTNYIKSEKLCPTSFSWQGGYGLFTYAHWDVPKINSYVRNQKKHHATESYEDEYKRLLKEAEVDFKDIYLF